MGKLVAVGNSPSFRLQTIQTISPSNTFCFSQQEDVATIAIEMLTVPTSAAPVIDDNKTLLGVISEFDIVKAYLNGLDLGHITASDVITSPLISATPTTTFSDAIKIMDDNRLFILPIINEEGEFSFSVTRQDLLRAILGLGWRLEKY